MGDWDHADKHDYDQYLLQQQAELPMHVLNDMTLDERITEYIEWQNSEFDKRLMVDAHLEIIKLRAENARLDAALLQTSDQLTDANERIAELEEALDDKNDMIGSLLMEKNDLEAENTRLAAELEAARKMADWRLDTMTDLRQQLENATGERYTPNAALLAQLERERIQQAQKMRKG